jgi:triosephosphate isomerase
MSESKRRRVIAGNWKMYKTLADTRSFFSAFVPLIKDVSHCDILIAPPFTAISAAVEAAKNNNVAIAGQNVSWSKEGAFTGEVSAPMLAEAGCATSSSATPSAASFFVRRMTMSPKKL